jgi:hypothetical protein
LHRRHPSHALPKNCSSRFIWNLHHRQKAAGRVVFLISSFRAPPEWPCFTYFD